MSRISLEEVYLRMAETLSGRSTCSRLAVGTVITNATLTQVLGIGYNGNAKGLDNKCDSDDPGNCGCIHSETNALIKAGTNPGAVAFITHMPCKMCAKMMINAEIARVVYRNAYRDETGLRLLLAAKTRVEKL